jgi:hypothetical protein
MEKLSRAFSLHPEWIQPKTFERRFELRVGDLLFGTLVFQKMTGSMAVARTDSGAWTFKRVGFFNPRITVRNDGSEADAGIYSPKWSGSSGTIQMADGTLYQWRHANFWATRMEWTDGGGRVLVTYQSGVENSRLSDALKTQATMEFSQDARSVPDLPLLILLGWYLVILHQEDAAAAVAAS